VAYLLLNAESYNGEIWHADAYLPCAGHVLGFMSTGVVVTKIMIFFQKCVQIDLDICCGESPQATGRSVGPYAVGLYQPAGWLATTAHWHCMCCVSAVQFLSIRFASYTHNYLVALTHAVAAQRVATACYEDQMIQVEIYSV